MYLFNNYVYEYMDMLYLSLGNTTQIQCLNIKEIRFGAAFHTPAGASLLLFSSIACTVGGALTFLFIPSVKPLEYGK